MWWEHWFDDDLTQKIDTIIKRGMVRAEDGRLVMNGSMMTDPFWLHVSGSTDCRNCLLWNEIFFLRLGVIHSFCRYHCWKVVTHPRNVKELIQFHNLMYVVPFVYNFINPLPGKAGLDVRGHTGKPYSAFNYATSLTEALRIKEIMHYMVRTYMPTEEIDGKHLEDTIFVKRSCTEMEGKINKSEQVDESWWDLPQTRAEWEIEHRLEEMFSNPLKIDLQPAWLRDKILDKWLRHANSIGDKSVIEFIGSDIFNVQSKIYEGQDLRPKGGEAKPKPKKREAKRSQTKEKK